ncbi:hypothetical protein SKAU_G00416060 [Synaphobranchus kaupii]|uniref:Integrase zinc-binding domain-containing protein n=1 Tax=Synaphobranchus kaupii TaxID=118154 RepID=A0A9Q1I9M3_SYNKA|nr:hypothetical protein SKAU_G00416060 [Synaphobranchus kaupii]
MALLTAHGDSLYYGGRRIILTEEEKVAVLTEVHAGHFGPRRMQEKIAPRFYWRGITQDTLDWEDAEMCSSELEEELLESEEEMEIGNTCLRVVREAAQRHGKDVFIADMYAVPTWKHEGIDPLSGLPKDPHLKDALVFPSLDKLQWTRALLFMCK